MYVDVNTIITAAALLGALLAIGAFAWKIITWVLGRNNTTRKVNDLEKKHNSDIEEIQKELCELSYAVLAALDGLLQKGCNGNVTIAHERLQKHINKRAHSQE